jgi:hypothetical protein
MAKDGKDGKDAKSGKGTPRGKEASWSDRYSDEHIEETALAIVGRWYERGGDRGGRWR